MGHAIALEVRVVDSASAAEQDHATASADEAFGSASADEFVDREAQAALFQLREAYLVASRQS